MINTGITIKLYSFSELSEKAKKEAIEAHRDFETNIAEDAQYNYCLSDESIIEHIEANKYLFFENGELAHTITYCGKHPLAGETHFIFQGKDYLIDKK
jgi:hypothetical protein